MSVSGPNVSKGNAGLDSLQMERIHVTESGTQFKTALTYVRATDTQIRITRKTWL